MNARCCIGKKQGTTLVVCPLVSLFVLSAQKCSVADAAVLNPLVWMFFFHFQSLSFDYAHPCAPPKLNLVFDSSCMANYRAFLPRASHGVVFMLHTVTLLSRASVPMFVCPSFNRSCFSPQVLRVLLFDDLSCGYIFRLLQSSV